MNKVKHNRDAILRFLFLAAAVCLPAFLRAGISYTYTVSDSELNVYNVSAPNGDTYARIGGMEFFGSGEHGQPELPYKVLRFLVPDDAVDFSVSIEPLSEAETFPLDSPLYPVQADIPINDYSDDKFVYSDREAYVGLETSFRAEVLDEARLEGIHHVVSVGLWPFAYSGSRNSLEICRSIRVSLDYQLTGTGMRKAGSEKRNGIVDIANIVVNPDGMQKSGWITIGGGLQGMHSQQSYYIISERSFLPALEDLAAWKAQKGYRVEMKAIEDIYEDSRYEVGANGIVDEAASLRKYLQDEFAKYGTFFCFLVGDYRTRMPIRKVFYNDSNYHNYNYNGGKFIPTDAYFANLSDNGWNLYLDNSGYYVGAYANVDYSYDIYVGRLLCHTSEEIENYIAKLTLYETNPGRGDSDYLNTSLLSVEYDGRLYYKDALNKMKDMFPQVKCMLDTMISNYNARHSPTGEMVLTKINKTGYCSLMGHGEPSTIACSGILDDGGNMEYIKALECYKNRNDKNPELDYQTYLPSPSNNSGIDLMNNVDSPSVIYSLACTTEPFDLYEPDHMIFDIPHTIASSYTCGGKYGGVAFLGNTRAGYWWSSPYLEASFLSSLQNNRKIGVAEAMSKHLYTKDKLISAAHNLIGDPEFEMWIQAPTDIDVYYSWNKDNICVWGQDCLECTVAVSDGEGDVRRKYISQVPLAPVDYINGGKMDAIGIFKTGFLPIVRINCYNDSVTDCDKKFVVRNASLGFGENANVTISSNAKVDIRAVDSIDCGPSLNISTDGSLNLRCDKNVVVKGSKVMCDANLKVTGERVVLSGGFSVSSGGTLSVNSK